MTRLLYFLCLMFAVNFTGCGGVKNAEFQSDADFYRLQDLQYYGELIEAYKNKTKNYPFQDEAKQLPVYAVIASPEQIDDVDKLPFTHIEKTTADFFNELYHGLGRPIEEYYDPQYEPDNKPNFYIYMVKGDRYFFAVHVSEPYDFAQKIRPGYNKVEISNAPGNDSYASTPYALFQHISFKAATDVTVSNPDFFRERRQRFLNATQAKR